MWRHRLETEQEEFLVKGYLYMPLQMLGPVLVHWRNVAADFSLALLVRLFQFLREELVHVLSKVRELHGDVVLLY